jgi:hypothetical protein
VGIRLDLECCNPPVSGTPLDRIQGVYLACESKRLETSRRSESDESESFNREDAPPALCKVEHVGCDPKDGELCPGKVKPVETLVEACSGSDVQIDRVTWV